MNYKLIGVPTLDSGSGHAVADAADEHLNLWKCESLVVGMCFDTPASNSNIISEAYILREKSLERNVFLLSGRRYMLQVLLSDAFTLCFEPSSGHV